MMIANTNQWCGCSTWLHKLLITVGFETDVAFAVIIERPDSTNKSRAYVALPRPRWSTRSYTPLD